MNSTTQSRDAGLAQAWWMVAVTIETCTSLSRRCAFIGLTSMAMVSRSTHENT